jgi:23S rRNA pseudouridine2605 synthase
MPPRRPNTRKQFVGRGSSTRKARPKDETPRRSRPKGATFKHRPRGGRDGVQHEESGERLQKVLAAAGVASRRECEQLILEGRVEIDRKVVTELGTRVDPQKQDIRVDGEALPHPKLVYFAINKPVGVVSTARDPAGRMRVTDLMPPNAPRVFCVGRLDITSDGLILVTNDGELANGLTHPRHGVEKIYHVEVAGKVEPEVLTQLHRGVHLAEGFAHAKHVRIKSRHKKSTLLEMVLDEGRNREIRRLLARVGHKVQRLTRIAVGPVRLGDLPTGAVRPLTPKEIAGLQEVVARGPREEHRTVKKTLPRPAKPRGPSAVGKKNQKRRKDGRTVIG